MFSSHEILAAYPPMFRRLVKTIEYIMLALKYPQWMAVDIPQLHYLKDVIVLSVQGPRRAADWLAGGKSVCPSICTDH